MGASGFAMAGGSELVVPVGGVTASVLLLPDGWRRGSAGFGWRVVFERGRLKPALLGFCLAGWGGSVG